MPSTTVHEQLETQRAKNALAVERLRARHLRELAKISSVRRGPSPAARYDAATRTRLRPGPRALGGAPTRHLSAFVQDALRRDVQDLKRNSSAARIVMARAAEIIAGDGPVVTSTTDVPAWNEACDAAFNAWFDAVDPDLFGHPDRAQRLSGPEMIAGVVGAWCTDGDQLVVHTFDAEGHACFQIVEGERLRAAAGTRVALPGGKSIVDGVELDPAGAPIAYHVASWTITGTLDTASIRRVPAEAARLMINPIGVEAGFVRGVPALQACLDRIERLDAYDQATAVAAEIATRFCAIVESSQPADLQSAWELGTEQAAPARPDAPRTIELQAGMLHFLEKGGTVKALDPKFPTTNFRDFVLWQFMVLGAELGVPIVAALFDATGLSWSNIKALLALSMRSVEPAQARLARLVRWMRAVKVTEWMRDGTLTPRDDWHRCDIVMPRAPVVDFKSEVEGHILAINNNLETQEQATQALGTGRAKDIRAVRQLERRDEIDKNITPPALPGAKPIGEAGGGDADGEITGTDEGGDDEGGG